MNPNLAKINLRVNQALRNSTISSSSFYKDETFRNEELDRIDQCISELIQADNRALLFKADWEVFKKELPDLILLHSIIESLSSEKAFDSASSLHSIFQEVHLEGVFDRLSKDPALFETIKSIKEIWNKFKGSQQDFALTKKLKELLDSKTTALQSKIQELQPPNPIGLSTQPSNQVQEREAKDDEFSISRRDKALFQIAEEIKFFFEDKNRLHQVKPNLCDVIDSLSISLDDGLYGEKIKEAFLDSDPIVLNRTSLLKFLIIEDSKRLNNKHLIKNLELDVTGDLQEKILIFQKKLREYPPSLKDLEAIFHLEEGMILSPSQEEINKKLNEIVQNIKLERVDEQIYTKFLYDTLSIRGKARTLYEKEVSLLEFLSDPFHKMNRLEVLLSAIRQFIPDFYFKQLDLSFDLLAKIQLPKKHLIKDRVVDFFFAVLEQNPDLCCSVPLTENFQNLFIDLVKDPIDMSNPKRHLFVILVLFRMDRDRAVHLTENLLEVLKSQKDFSLPPVLYSLLMQASPLSQEVRKLALEVTDYLPLESRVDCLIDLFQKGEPSLDEKIKNNVLSLLKETFSQYLDEKTSYKASLVKIKLREIFRCLENDLRVLFPEKSPNQIKFDFLMECIESQMDPAKKVELCTMFFPEFVAIGQKEVAIRLAKESINVMKPEDLSLEGPLLRNLLNTIAFTAGIELDGLEKIVFGTISEETKSESYKIDEDLSSLYLETIQCIEPLIKRLDKCLLFSVELHQKFPDFSEKIALYTVNLIKESFNDPHYSTMYQLTVRTSFLKICVKKFKNIFPNLVLQIEGYLKDLELSVFNLFQMLLSKNHEFLFKAYISPFAVPVFVRTGHKQEALELVKTVLLGSHYSNNLNRIDFLEFFKSILSVIEYLENETGDSIDFEDVLFRHVLSLPHPEDRINELISLSDKLKEYDFSQSSYRRIMVRALSLTIDEVSRKDTRNPLSDKKMQISQLKEISEKFKLEIPDIDNQIQELVSRLENELLDLQIKSLKDLNSSEVQEELIYKKTEIERLKKQISDLESLIDLRENEKIMHIKTLSIGVKRTKKEITSLKNQLDALRNKLLSLQVSCHLFDCEFQISLRVELMKKLLDKAKYQEISVLAKETCDLLKGENYDDEVIRNFIITLAESMKKIHDLTLSQGLASSVSVIKELKGVFLEFLFLKPLNQSYGLDFYPGFRDYLAFEGDLLKSLSLEFSKIGLQKIREIHSEDVIFDRKLQVKLLKKLRDSVSEFDRNLEKLVLEDLKQVQISLLSLYEERRKTSDQLMSLKIALEEIIPLLIELDREEEAIELGKRGLSMIQDKVFDLGDNELEDLLRKMIDFSKDLTDESARKFCVEIVKEIPDLENRIETFKNLFIKHSSLRPFIFPAILMEIQNLETESLRNRVLHSLYRSEIEDTYKYQLVEAEKQFYT